MNQFFKNFTVFVVVFSSVNIFAQQSSLGDNNKRFAPKFSIGSGLYTLTGDIENNNKDLLKGKSGFHAGMKFDVRNNLDVSFLFVKSSFAANDGIQAFSSDVDGFGLHLGYTMDNFLQQSKIYPAISIGVQNLGVSTVINDIREESSVLVLPVSVGFRMNITQRLQFDVSMDFGMGMGDIDMAQEGNSDGFQALNFTVHYDLFTSSSNKNDDYFDDSYYADVDFKKLESTDEDGDGIYDMDDYCPRTPKGVKVDDNGCPMDDDNDGIYNYLDQEKNTPTGSVVDENGVRLSPDKYKSRYSDLEVASRKYADFYNEYEIKREDYKTVDEYLIAKANAFNKAYNESVRDNIEVKDLIYKVKLGEFIDIINPRVQKKLLSFDDLESVTMSDGIVVYSVGQYSTFDEAFIRAEMMSKEGFGDAIVIVDNNGRVSNYVPPSASEIDDSKIVSDPNQEENVPVIDLNSEEDSDIELVSRNKNSNYRVQIGAFNSVLSDEIFIGVDDVISFVGNDGWVRYMTGSFDNYRDAVVYQAEMRARGFEDAFIVTYRNGERISLNTAIKKDYVGNPEDESVSNKQEVDDGLEPDRKISFIVQILVSEETVSNVELSKMTQLGDVVKEQSGLDMYVYYAGSYSSLEEANFRLIEAQSVGFINAFVFATKDGERVTLEQAKDLLRDK